MNRETADGHCLPQMLFHKEDLGYTAILIFKFKKRLPLASAKSERLITLPTRGVFAEGKLGHCNVSEEIDDTRFWRWEEHPIPFEAPGINPVS